MLRTHPGEGGHGVPVAPLVFVLIAALGSITGCAGPPAHEGNGMQGLHEASMNFDLDTLQSFLPRVERLVDSGFGPVESDQIMDLARTLEVGAEARREFQVVHGGQGVVLRIQVVMDDLEAPDVYFFTSEELAKAIGDEMIAFGDELGL